MASDISAVGGAGQGPQAVPGTATAVATGAATAAAVAPVQPVANAAPAGDVLQQAARQVAASLPGNNGFNFIFDKASGMTIVKVINKDTGEVVRQIPTEEVVRIAQLFRQDEAARSRVLDVTA